METIKNYIESMFRNLPQTEKVLRAKSELFQMMEDKYTELIKDGKSENEAVGTVISEFGNLEELAPSLGIADIFKTTKEENINRRKITFDEAEGYINAKRKNSFMIALGVFFCITCVMGPIITDAFRIADKYGVIALFVFLAIGISCFILSDSCLEEYNFMKEESCGIDSAVAEHINNKRKAFNNTYTMMLSSGVLLCCLCFVPTIIFDGMGVLEDLSASLLFLLVGTGVFLITYANNIKKSFENLLNINTVPLNKKKSEREEKYSNKTILVIMTVYWQTITCIYLCISFMSSAWHLTWLIWPIAALIRTLLVACFAERDED